MQPGQNNQLKNTTAQSTFAAIPLLVYKCVTSPDISQEKQANQIFKTTVN